MIDAYPMYRMGLRSLIESVGWCVAGEANDVDSALPLLRATPPDAVVVDFLLNGGVGLSRLQMLLTSEPKLRALVTGNNEERLCALPCLEAGALGYLEKSEPAAAVLEALRNVVAGEIYLSEPMRSMALARGSLGRKAFVPIQSLSGRERDVYRLLGQGQSIKQIAATLGISAKTVEYHRQGIKTKLQLGSGAALNRHAMIRPLEEEAEADSAAAGESA